MKCLGTVITILVCCGFQLLQGLLILSSHSHTKAAIRPGLRGGVWTLSKGCNYGELDFETTSHCGYLHFGHWSRVHGYARHRAKFSDLATHCKIRPHHNFPNWKVRNSVLVLPAQPPPTRTGKVGKSSVSDHGRSRTSNYTRL